MHKKDYTHRKKKKNFSETKATISKATISTFVELR